MTQATPTIGADKSGVEYRTEDNDGKKALLNHHKGASAPAYAEAGIIWLDDTATPWILKIYDGTDWITLGEINATANSFNPYQGTSAVRLLSHATDTGAANAYAVAPVPAITAYATGMIVTLKPANNQTAAATLAVNGLTAKNIKTLAGADPASGAMTTTGVYQLVYDGTNFVLLNSAAAASGAWTLLATATASSSTSLDFTSLIDNTYDHYVFDVCGIENSATANLGLRYSTDGGSSWASSSGNYFCALISTDSSIEASGYNCTETSLYLALTDGSMGADSKHSVNGMVHLYLPASTALHKHFRFELSQSGGSGFDHVYQQSGGGTARTTSAVNGIRFLPSAGNFVSGKIRMYGVK